MHPSRHKINHNILPRELGVEYYLCKTMQDNNEHARLNARKYYADLKLGCGDKIYLILFLEARPSGNIIVEGNILPNTPRFGSINDKFC